MVRLFSAAFFATISILPAYASDKVGGFGIGSRGFNVFSSNNVAVFAVPDPVVRGVTCHVQVIEVKGLTLAADPSNSSIACRQTGQMFAEDVNKVNKSPEGEVIFSADKGSGLSGARLTQVFLNLFKDLNVRRMWDASSQTYVYVTYTTKLFDGSPKTSLSTVTTYGQWK